jgi:hypothetical protein
MKIDIQNKIDPNDNKTMLESLIEVISTHPFLTDAVKVRITDTK